MDQDGQEHDHRHNEAVAKLLESDGTYRKNEEGVLDDPSSGNVFRSVMLSYEAMGSMMHGVDMEPGTFIVKTFQFNCGYTGAIVLLAMEPGSCRYSQQGALRRAVGQQGRS